MLVLSCQLSCLVNEDFVNEDFDKGPSLRGRNHVILGRCNALS